MRSKQTASVLFTVGGFIADYLLSKLLPVIPTYFIATLGGGILLIGAILWFDETKLPERPVRAELARPVLDLQPLRHYKGYLLPPQTSEERTLPDGKKSFDIKHVGASHPDEYQHVEPSQKLEAGTFEGPRMKGELIVKFGVIKVACSEADAISCRAQLRYRFLLDLFGRPSRDPNFYNAGNVNWYSVARQSETQHKIEEIILRKHFGINSYLSNPVEDVHVGESKYLRVFYMIKDLPIIYLCTDAPNQQVGTIDIRKPFEFEIEITVTAQNYLTSKWLYRITVREFDDYTIARLPPNSESSNRNIAH